VGFELINFDLRFGYNFLVVSFFILAHRLIQRHFGQRLPRLVIRLFLFSKLAHQKVDSCPGANFHCPIPSVSVGPNNGGCGLGFSAYTLGCAKNSLAGALLLAGWVWARLRGEDVGL